MFSSRFFLDPGNQNPSKHSLLPNTGDRSSFMQTGPGIYFYIYMLIITHAYMYIVIIKYNIYYIYMYNFVLADMERSPACRAI